MASKSSVLLIGMGGVGTIAALALEKGGQSEVTCVARSSYDILTTTGFQIHSCDYGEIANFKPDHIVHDIPEAMEKYGPFNFVVITTKNIPDVYPVEPLIKQAYHKDTTFVLLQNGIGIELPVFEQFPEISLVSGCTMVGSTLYHDTIKQVGPDNISIGTFINPNTPEEPQVARCKKFVEIYTNKYNQVTYEPNVKFVRWKKLVYNATVNTGCALTNVDSGRLMLFGGDESICRPAMKEVLAVAKADGVIIPEETMTYMMDANVTYYPPSMLIDVRKGNYVEYIIMCQNVVKYGEKYGVPTPTLTVMSNLLHIIQMRTMEEKGRFELPPIRPRTTEDYTIEFKY